MVQTRSCFFFFFYLWYTICLAQKSDNGSIKLSCEEIQEIIVLAKGNFEEIKGAEDSLVKADARVFKSKRTFGIIGTTSVFDDPDYDRVGLNFAVYQGKDKSVALP